jgi:hypothetical protein
MLSLAVNPLKKTIGCEHDHDVDGLAIRANKKFATTGNSRSGRR